MSLDRFALAVLTIGLFAASASPAGAQGPEPPSDAPVQVGPLTLAPVIALTDFGHDSNVYNLSSNQHPTGDMTATVSPSVDAWLRLPHASMNARSLFSYFYFRELTGLRSLDSDSAVRLNVPLNRLTPYVEGTLVDTSHRQNLEIDAITRRRVDDVRAGAYLRLTPKVSAGAYIHRARMEYEARSFYLNTDLAAVLNHRSSGVGTEVRWAVTPYTTVAVEMNRNRDYFDSTGGSNGKSTGVVPSVEFNPLAVVSGHASFGFLKHQFFTSAVPDYKGTIASADLSYIFRERTRFSVAARRGLEYSYLLTARDYISQEINGYVTQRLGQSWDVGGSFGRGKVNYRQDSINLADVAPDENILTSTVEVGYNLGRTRVGFHLERRVRQAQGNQDREYNRLRIGSSVRYVF